MSVFYKFIFVMYFYILMYLMYFLQFECIRKMRPILII